MTMNVVRQVAARLPTESGNFELVSYRDAHANKDHLALIMGEVRGATELPVRVHSECITGEIFGSSRCDCGEQLRAAMSFISQEGRGVIVYLRQEGRNIGLNDKLRAYNLQDSGYDTVDANLALGRGADERTYGAASQILEDLDVASVRLITNNPAKAQALEKSGISVCQVLHLPPAIKEENLDYLRTKIERMNHHIDLNYRETADFAELIETCQMRHHRSDFPAVTLTYAQSLDGCIARTQGKPTTLSGPSSLAMTHTLRANHDAIIVGIGTLLADDPSLNVRYAEGDDPQPVVVDSQLRFPDNARVLRVHPRRPWIVTTHQACSTRELQLKQAGCRIIRVSESANGRVNLADMFRHLKRVGIDSTMVEGGGQIITSAVEAQLASSFVVTIAPRLIGGYPALGRIHDRQSPVPSFSKYGSRLLGEDIVVFGRIEGSAP